jgi:hypothetical protein
MTSAPLSEERHNVDLVFLVHGGTLSYSGFEPELEFGSASALA